MFFINSTDNKKDNQSSNDPFGWIGSEFKSNKETENKNSIKKGDGKTIKDLISNQYNDTSNKNETDKSTINTSKRNDDFDFFMNSNTTTPQQKQDKINTSNQQPLDLNFLFNEHKTDSKTTKTTETIKTTQNKIANHEEKTQPPKCICGQLLVLKQANMCYANGNAINCDSCGISIEGNILVYHCNVKSSDKHYYGFDLCDKCSITSIFDKSDKNVNISKYSVEYKVNKNSMIFYPTPNIKRGTKKFKTVPFYCSSKCPTTIEGVFDSNKRIVNEFDEICSFIKCAELAYAKHYPLLIKPQHIFILIIQAISIHVDKNAEKLRYKFVDHEDKMQLIVPTNANFIKGSHDNDWGSVINQFIQQIDKNTKNDIVPLFDSNFSTSTLTEKIAAKITLMSTCKNYFDYKMRRCVCGFPEITLDGTINDWILLKTKVKTLLSKKVTKKFGIQWSKSLIPILDRFIAAFKGDISMVFWNSMIYKGQWSYWKTSGAYGRGGKVKAYKKFISGWINIFFPFVGKKNYENQWAFMPYSGDKNANEQYKGKSSLGPEPKEFPNGTASAPVLWKYGYRTTYKLDFVAGFMGYEQDKQTLQLKPVIGWYIKENDETDSRKKRF